MAEFDYDHIADIHEDDLDCLSIEALFAELTLVDLGVAHATDGEDA